MENEKYFYVYIHKRRKGFETPSLEAATHAAARFIDAERIGSDHASIYAVQGMNSTQVGSYLPLTGFLPASIS